MKADTRIDLVFLEDLSLESSKRREHPVHGQQNGLCQLAAGLRTPL